MVGEDMAFVGAWVIPSSGAERSVGARQSVGDHIPLRLDYLGAGDLYPPPGSKDDRGPDQAPGAVGGRRSRPGRERRRPTRPAATAATSAQAAVALAVAACVATAAGGRPQGEEAALMSTVILRMLRWLFHGNPEPPPVISLPHQDELLREAEFQVRRLSDPVTGILRGERRPRRRRRPFPSGGR